MAFFGWSVVLTGEDEDPLARGSVSHERSFFSLQHTAWATEDASMSLCVQASLACMQSLCSFTLKAHVASVLRSGSAWFLDNDGLQPQPVGTTPSYLCNWTEPHRTSSYWTGCSSATDFNQSHQRPVRTSCYQS